MNKLMEVMALDDTLIQPNSVCNVVVHAAFKGHEGWIIEKVIIGMDNQNIMASPTTWISTSCPFIPIANPSPLPPYTRAGEVVGYLHDPEIMADKPGSEEHLNRMIPSAEALKKTIIGTVKAQDLATAVNPTADYPGHNDQFKENEPWGPKTMAVLEDPVRGDVDQLVNLGPDIPEEYHKCLAEVLCSNAAAFSVDGQLGHIKAQVPIPLLPNTQPISKPMCGASSAKREVIDQQLKTWFEAGVIELSWGFPVVVGYQNSKP